MFKSVFSRIMTIFTVIILCCFFLLVLVVASGLFQDGQQRELNQLQIAASEVACFLQNIQSFTMASPEILMRGESFRRNLSDISSFAEADVVVVRADGTVAVSSSPERKEDSVFLPEKTVKSIAEAGEDNPYTMSDLDGVLEKEGLNSFAVLNDPRGELLYLVVVSGSGALNTGFALSVTKRMVAVSIWIFFAAMICVSLVSRRITEPLKQIGEASKQYAQGQFTARVVVKGKDEIADLGKAFNNMASSLAAHEENRNTFLSNVSHDLRTPMTTISGFVDGMLDGTIPEEQHSHYLQVISGEVHRLSRLVNTLLEISRLESDGTMVTSEFNLTEKTRHILISLMGKIEAKKIDVVFEGGEEEDVFVLANSDAIHQVLYNLLDNAVKFTDERGTISISVSPVRGKKALVRIRNTGSGIPKEELPHVFERFYKSDRSRGLDKSGTGLGLYIVKTILEKHGESVSVSSAVGEYTEFSFTLMLVNGRKPRIPDADFVAEEPNPEPQASLTESAASERQDPPGGSDPAAQSDEANAPERNENT